MIEEFKDILTAALVLLAIVGGAIVFVLAFIWFMHFIDWYDAWLTNYFAGSKA